MVFFGATPLETMHCFHKIMIDVVTYCVLKNVSVNKQGALDRLLAFHSSQDCYEGVIS